MCPGVIGVELLGVCVCVLCVMYLCVYFSVCGGSLSLSFSLCLSLCVSLCVYMCSVCVSVCSPVLLLSLSSGRHCCLMGRGFLDTKTISWPYSGGWNLLFFSSLKW